MNKNQYIKALNELLQSMIGEDVNHIEFGLGTIVALEKDKCLVRYHDNPDSESRSMKIDTFFTYNEPISEKKLDELNKIKCEYDLSKSSINNENYSIEVDKINNKNSKITFDDVVGLENVKELILQMVVYPFKYKEIYKAFKRDSGGGILLYGAPGTGKTMIAKAIANEVNAKFFSVKCLDIASKWYGESERNIRDLFNEAKGYERSIIFFDEFDSLGTNRDEKNAHSVNTVVSELLSQIDGFESKKNTILLIASTNKPWNIDSALLRSGRFNKKIYIGLPNLISRVNLFSHNLKDIPIEEIDFKEMANRTDGYSSADIVEVCNVTKDIAIKRSISLKQISKIAKDDVIEAISRVSSTVVKKELDKLVNFTI